MTRPFLARPLQNPHRFKAILARHFGIEQNQVGQRFLLDLKMPRMNGFEVLLWLQGEEALKQIPVVVLSGSILAKDKEEALVLGAREYCVKPATGDEYIEFVKELHARWLG